MADKPIRSLQEKFVEAWANIKNPELDGFNPHYKNSYATLAATLGVVKDACAPLGIAYEQNLVNCNGAYMLATKVVDGSDERALSTFPIDNPPNSQAFGSEMTYKKRQAAQCDWGIVGEVDDDGEAAVKQTVRKPGAEKPVSSPVEVAKGRLWHDVTVYAEKTGIGARDEYRRLMVQAQNMQGCSNMDELTADTITTVCELYEQEVFNV